VADREEFRRPAVLVQLDGIVLGDGRARGDVPLERTNGLALALGQA
jgi:hypothetical protein